MRKPRDLDAELAALAERTAALKVRRVVQLGELVIASGADALGADTLVGALTAAATETNAQILAQWRRSGEAVFRGERPRKIAQGHPHDQQKAGEVPGPEQAH
ncbi:conjugal transfer protein TraD [Brevundimonas aurantiaca]|uniref:Conjugal transfer protein TraD n=1 Tax=Brevundimonas aurantiaca TaxID=74316 RepID=A0A7W9C9D9_9CAUL|nr:conjugal transfer protein TraD [Brevundimonas aurantiaca]MBB5741496.1 hypothetical protein [Brevundimonas aurantiaca]